MTSQSETKSALSFYRASSIITGVFLLFVVAEMVIKYVFGQTIWAGGSAGFLGLVPNPVDNTGFPEEGIDISKTLLQVHGLLYVIYLFADFRIWRLAELKFKDFVVIALGGIIPLSSFFIERSYHKKLEAIFAAKVGAKN
jgi:integral membrane protein